MKKYYYGYDDGVIYRSNDRKKLLDKGLFVGPKSDCKWRSYIDSKNNGEFVLWDCKLNAEYYDLDKGIVTDFNFRNPYELNDRIYSEKNLIKNFSPYYFDKKNKR